MEARRLGAGGPLLSPIGFGAFKIGRNQKTKYAQGYDLPDAASAARLLNGILDAGVNYIDTAPAYGISEERIGQALSHRRSEFVLSTKVGETFSDGQSSYDFSAAAIERSVTDSLHKLQTELLDIVFLHSNGADLQILQDTPAVETLLRLRDRGLVRQVGMSGKTVVGAQAALAWADVLMVEYHVLDRSHEEVIAAAAARGVGVVVKKPLASGTIEADTAVRFVFSNPHVASMVVGSLCLDHLKSNLESCRKAKD